MPQSYENPDFTPCLGTYTWVPTTSPNIGGLNYTLGFSNLIIDRGTFRNYWYKKNTEKNINVKIFDGNTNIGFIFNPIINATRPLALGFPVLQGSGSNVAITNVNSQNLIEFDFLTDSSKRLSCIQIDYDLSIWSGDTRYNFNLNPAPPAVLVYGVRSDDGGEELISTDLFSGLPLTRTRSLVTETGLDTASESTAADSGPHFVDTKIKIKEEIFDRSKFPRYKSIIFKTNPDIISLPSSISFVIKKIMFFTADRVNFRFAAGTSQLPCKALGYSMAIDGTFFPPLSIFSSIFGGGGTASSGSSAGSTGIFTWPSVLPDNCDIHVKLFNPDFTSNSPGFAHSLNLHLLIFVMPIFGPIGDFFLPGVAQPHYGVILGPKKFTQQWIFYGNGNNNNLQLAVMNSALSKINSGTASLQESNQNVGEQKQIYTLVKGFDFIVKKQFYYEQLGISTSGIFKNNYIDSFGIPKQSETYNGSVPRGNIFSAIEPVSVFPRTSKKQFSYSTFLFNGDPNLYDLFSNSEPCLLFKCLSPDGFSDSIFIEPGFLYASINCFSTNPSGMFDTKLVYRFFVCPKGSENPISPSTPSKTIKIQKSGKDDSSIITEAVTRSWDFSNTLVTGNIVSNLNNVETSEIINQSLKIFSPLDGKPYDLYCGIYAMSSLNDRFAGYNLTNFSTLDVPTVTFSINNDFIIQLPIYYRKSLENGGTLQAQRDFGLKGKYVSDSLSYVIVTQKYNGLPWTGGTYNGLVSSNEGVNGLFTFIDSSAAPSDQKKFNIQAGENITETDYVLLVESTSNARIGDGLWELKFDANIPVDVEVKFEVDLVDRKTSNLILKVLSSEFNKLISNSSSAEIKIPFFLPENEGLLVVKIFLRNKTKAVINIEVNEISLISNTIQQFSFVPQQTGNYLIGFYEDLPIQPNSFVSNCQNFILILDINSAGYVIFDPAAGLKINGAIYSPTWVVDLPQNMELQYNASQINKSRTGTIVNGVEPYKIFFRTGTSNDVKIIDTKRHQNGLIVTVANTKTNTSDNAVQQIVSESAARNTTNTNLVSTPLSNLNLEELDLKNPILSKSDNQNIPLALAGQNLKNADISTLLFGNKSPGYYSAQPSDNGTLMPINESGLVVSKAKNCAINTFDFKNDQSNNLGVTANGNLIYSINQSSSTSNATNFILAEGDPLDTSRSQELINFQDIYIGSGPDNQYLYYGPVQTTFPGIIVTESETVAFYVFAKTNSLSNQAKSNRDISNIQSGTAIYGRFLSGASISSVFLAFDFKDYCEKNSGIIFNNNEFPIINQITVCKNDIYTYGNAFNIAFDSGGKIFVLRTYIANNNVFFSGLGILYGNLETSSDEASSKFLNSLKNMISNASLYKFRYKDRAGIIKTFYNKDLDFSQKVGFVDFDGIFMGVQFYIGSDIYEILIDKSYVLEGEYRKIGEIN